MRPRPVDTAPRLFRITQRLIHFFRRRQPLAAWAADRTGGHASDGAAWGDVFQHDRTSGDARIFAVPRLVIGLSGRFPEIAEYYRTHVVEPARGALEALIDAGKAKGVIRDVDTKATARVFIGPFLFEALWTHVLGAPARAAAQARGADARAAATQDIGDIAVIEDDGTLLLPENAFDLRGRGLRFERNAAGGYDALPIDAAFRAPLGRRLGLQDDDTASESLPFAFPFYAQSHASVFVNSDGNLTFEQPDTASTARGLARLLGGPPRVAPFFADLDPSTGSGRVFVQAGTDAFTVTWCGVREFDSTRTMTVQAALLPAGAIEVKFGNTIESTSGIVALSPGRTGSFAPVNLDQQMRQAGGAAGVGERFAETPELDVVSAARRFYATHADRFDQLVFWTDTRVVQDAFAFETTVANAIEGLGIERFDASRDFGSGGALASVVVMDRIGKYSDDPFLRILGESSTLAVLAHETGHRWLARLVFSDGRGGTAEDLLGRQRAHWSFFMDSDASVMEGNDIEDLRGGAFRTVAAAERYSLLDLYAMGLVSAADVPPFFYVEAPINVVPVRERESAPRVGVTFNGTRRDVLIQDVIDALGTRRPAAAESPRLHRQAFVFVVSRGRAAGAGDLARLERIRREWEPFFSAATGRRMTVTTGLGR